MWVKGALELPWQASSRPTNSLEQPQPIGTCKLDLIAAQPLALKLGLMSNITALPKYALLSGAAASGLATVGMPFISGYGTVLAQVVGLSAWSLVASVWSGEFADQHHQFVWPIAAALNVVLFCVLALPAYFVMRRRAPGIFTLFIALWSIFYLGCLFVLFPATDGP